MRRFGLVVLVVLLALATCAVWAQEEITIPRHDFPMVGKYAVLVGDFHMHTNNSDGKLTPKERVDESQNMGYDVIAITDHGNMKAYRTAHYVGAKLGILVMPGFETGMQGKEHMNAIGVMEAFQPKDPHKWAEKPGEKTTFYQDEMKRIAGAGGVLIYNHPHVGYRAPLEWGIKQGYVVGIEVKNDVVKDKWNTVKWNGIDCYPEAFDYALKHNLALFADTDMHGKRNENPARTLLFVTAYTPQGVMDAIKNRRTVAWFDGVVWGRQPLLSDLLGVSVKAWKSLDGKVNFDNFTPIDLKGTVAGFTNGTLDLPAYSSATLDPGKDVSRKLDITWTNVWTDPRTNLKTSLGMFKQVK